MIPEIKPKRDDSKRLRRISQKEASLLTYRGNLKNYFSEIGDGFVIPAGFYVMVPGQNLIKKYPTVGAVIEFQVDPWSLGDGTLESAIVLLERLRLYCRMEVLAGTLCGGHGLPVASVVPPTICGSRSTEAGCIANVSLILLFEKKGWKLK